MKNGLTGYCDELKWLYCELYKNQDEKVFKQLCGTDVPVLYERKAVLKMRWTGERAKDPQGIKETG